MSWTERNDIFLRNNIGKITYREIASNLKKSKRTISYRVKKLGLVGINLSEKTQFKKIYSINERFFDDINIINSYYAGLIASDGCIYGNCISLTQSEKRLYSIKRFVDIVEFDGKIYKAKHKKGYNSFSVVITSKRWQNALKDNFGLTPKKSLTLEYPTIKDFDCKLSFMVGLIDGDGTVGFYKKKGVKKVALVFLCGTYSMVNWVKDLWDEYCFSVGKRKNNGPNKLTENNTWGTGISGFRAIKFYKLIKDLNIPKMESKWDVFENEFKINGEDFYLKDFSKERRRKNGKFI